MGKTTVIKPETGERLEVDESSVAILEKLNYRRETPDEGAKVAFDASVEEEYGGADQALLAAGEGFASGATFGLADPLMDDTSSRYRKELHPTAYGAGEIAGIVVPAIASAGGTVAAGTGIKAGAKAVLGATPAGIVARGAERVAGKVATGRLGHMAVAGGIEGVGQATAGLVSSALAGDEVTPEAIVNELGVGAMLGLGAGAAGRGVEKLAGKLTRMGSKADDLAEATGEVGDDIAARSGKTWVDSPEAYQYNKRIGGAVKDARAAAEKRFHQATDEFVNWAEEADAINQGIPEGAVARNVSSDTGNIRGPRAKAKPVAQADVHGSINNDVPLDGAKINRTYDVRDSQIVGEEFVDRGTRQVSDSQILSSDDVATSAATSTARLKGPAAVDPSTARLKGPATVDDAVAADPSKTAKHFRGSSKPTQKLGVDDVDSAAVADDLSSPTASGSGSSTQRLPGRPSKEEVFDAAIAAGQNPDKLDEAAKTLFNGRVPTDNFFGKEVHRRGKEVMGLIQARSAMDALPELSLESISKMSIDEVADLAQKFDVIHRHAPDLAKQLTAAMSEAFGSAAPKLRGWGALDVIGFHKVSDAAVAKLAAGNDAGKNVVALWATMKGLDEKVTKSAVAAAMKEGAEAAASKAGVDSKKGFAGRMVNRSAGKAAGAMLGGSAVGGPLGFVLGWAVTDGLQSGAMSKTVQAAKRRALLNTAKALGALKGPGRPAAIAHMAAGDKLRTPVSPLEDTSDIKEEQALARHRIEQAIFFASSAGRERLADTLAPMRAKSPELAASVEADTRRRAEYLAKFAPRKPQWAAMLGNEWVYPKDQIDRFAAVHRAVTQPMSVLEDFAAGTLTPDAAAAFRDTSPGLFKLVSSYIVDHFDASKASYSESFSVSMLLGMPMHPSLMFVPTLQQDFARPMGPQTGGVPGDSGAAAKYGTDAMQSTNS